MRDSLIEATANQTAERVVELYKSVEDVSINIMTDSYVLDYLFEPQVNRTYENYNLILNNITSIIFANKDIKYVALLDGKNILLNVSQGTDMIRSLSVLDQVKQDIPVELTTQSFVKAYQYQDTNCFAYVSRIRSLNDFRQNDLPYYVVIMFEVGEVENYLEPVFDRKKFTLRVLNYNDTILLSGHEGEFGQTFSEDVHAADSWCKMVTMTKPKWKLCFSVPKTSIGSDQSTFFMFMAVVILLNIMLLTVLIKILIKNISESISDIEEEIGVICGGQWGHRIRYKRNNEINSIAKSFNKLLDEYEATIHKNQVMEEEVHTAKLLQLEAQIEQLQEKISPHFLYNSMEYIKGVAQEHGVEKIADITSVLSQNFRYNMDAGREATVRKDLFYALSYFNVVNARRGNPIRLDIHIPPEVMEQSIIKMVFQPLVENTLKHGDLGADGVLELDGKIRDDGYVEISVKDNGRGIEPETLAKIQSSLLENNAASVKDDAGDHYGLLNVHTRLKLTYGDGCGLSVFSKVGEGTEILITVRQLSI